MVLPNNFSDTEFIQDVFRKVRNKQVREWFRDVGDENWEPDLGSLRAQYRVACTHKEDDSALETIMRIELFKDIRKIESSGNSGEITVFGTPDDDIDFTYTPQILLYFSQASLDVVQGEHYKEGRINFRWKGKTSSNVSNSDVNQLANRIKTIFATGSPYTWHKGKKYYYYKHREQGYDLRILALNEAEGKQLIRDVLSVQNDTPDWEYLSISEVNDESGRFPNTPGSQTILGKTVKKPHRRPIVKVRFRYAALKIHGYGIINLVDLTGIRKNPIVTAN